MVTRSDNDSSFRVGHCGGCDKKSAALPNRRCDPFCLGDRARVSADSLFILIGGGLFAGSFMITQQEEKQRTEQKKLEQKLALERKKEAQEEDDSVASFQVEPIAVEIGYGLIPIVDSSIDNSSDESYRRDSEAKRPRARDPSQSGSYPGQSLPGVK
jgi:flagellar biosynthesis protein FlhA